MAEFQQDCRCVTAGETTDSTTSSAHDLLRGSDAVPNERFDLVSSQKIEDHAEQKCARIEVVFEAISHQLLPEISTDILSSSSTAASSKYDASTPRHLGTSEKYRGQQQADELIECRDLSRGVQTKFASIELCRRSSSGPVLVTGCSMSKASPHHLVNVEDEARAISDALATTHDVRLRLDVDAASLDEALEGRSIWFFCGHGDCLRRGDGAPGFVGRDGQPEVLPAATLVEILRRHAASTLKLVVLSGCAMYPFARRLLEAGVSSVVCWKTRVNDEAASRFTKAFSASLANQSSVPQAFDRARLAVASVTERGCLGNGCLADVPKFAFIDPDDVSQVFAEGDLVGRLRDFPNSARRGPLAAGVPMLLDTRALGADLAAFQEAPNPTLRGTYVHRAEEFEATLTALTSSPSARILSLLGMIGTGKSTIAAVAVHDAAVRRHFSDGILWVAGERMGSADLIFRTVADRMHSRLLPRFGDHAAPPCTRVLPWISERVSQHAMRALVVLDDLPTSEASMALLKCGLSVLVTTQKRSVAVAGGAKVIEVGCVANPIARDILALSAGVDTLSHEAEQVLVACANLPLVLRLAGALYRRDKTWAKLSENWQDGGSKLEEFFPMDTPGLESLLHLSLRAAIEKSVRQLPHQIAVGYRGLALAPNRMPLDDSVLTVMLGCDEAKTIQEWRDELCDHSLLQLAQDGTCTLHDLLLNYLRSTGPPASAVERLEKWLLSPTMLAGLWENGNQLSSYELRMMMLWREVERVHGKPVAGSRCLVALKAEARDDETTSALETQAESLLFAMRQYKMAWLLTEMGSDCEAVALYESALGIQQSLLGHDHVEVASTLCNLGNVVLRQGRQDAAAALYERALAIKERVLGSEHVEVAITLSNLAHILEARGSCIDAMATYQRALSIIESTFGTDHPELAITLSNLGHVQQSLGRLDEATVSHERALAIKERALGGKHLEVAISLSNLASVHQANGRYSEAAVLYDRALQIETAVLGDRHPEVAVTLSNLGNTLQSLGDPGRAMTLCERALEMKEELFGANHPEVAITVGNLGNAHYLLGQHDSSVALHQRALSIQEKAYGPKHAEVANTLNNMATVLQAQGRLEAAAAAYERMRSIQ